MQRAAVKQTERQKKKSGAKQHNSKIADKEKTPKKEKVYNSSDDESEENVEPKEKKSGDENATGYLVAPNSSLQVTGKLINTVVGPIHEWACIPDNLPAHPTMAFFGKRRTGKSTSITNIAFHCCRDIPFGLVMSDTAYAGKSRVIRDRFFD